MYYVEDKIETAITWTAASICWACTEHKGAVFCSLAAIAFVAKIAAIITSASVLM